MEILDKCPICGEFLTPNIFTYTIDYKINEGVFNIYECCLCGKYSISKEAISEISVNNHVPSVSKWLNINRKKYQLKTSYPIISVEKIAGVFDNVTLKEILEEIKF